MIRINRIDHLVLTVADIERTCNFYRDILGFEVVTFANDRKALKFGCQKINLHQAGHEFEPKALQPTPGSADLCLIAETSIEKVISTLNQAGVKIKEGPVERTGTEGPICFVYLRDPDKNLIEISNYLST